jgi:hypothetical protein
VRKSLENFAKFRKNNEPDNVQILFSPISEIPAAPVVYTAVDIDGLYSASQGQGTSVFMVGDTNRRFIEILK